MRVRRMKKTNEYYSIQFCGKLNIDHLFDNVMKNYYRLASVEFDLGIIKSITIESIAQLKPTQYMQHDFLQAFPTNYLVFDIETHELFIYTQEQYKKLFEKI